MNINNLNSFIPRRPNRRSQIPNSGTSRTSINTSNLSINQITYRNPNFNITELLGNIERVMRANALVINTNVSWSLPPNNQERGYLGVQSNAELCEKFLALKKEPLSSSVVDRFQQLSEENQHRFLNENNKFQCPIGLSLMTTPVVVVSESHATYFVDAEPMTQYMELARDSNVPVTEVTSRSKIKDFVQATGYESELSSALDTFEKILSLEDQVKKYEKLTRTPDQSVG